MARKPLSSGRRKPETRDVRIVVKSDLTFSFKYFQDLDGVGQSLQNWIDTDPQSVKGLFDKLVYLSSNTVTSSQQTEILALYQRFPSKKDTDFKCPPGLEDENWGTIKKLNGQKGRAAGFLKDNVFYLVYLDREHVFWKSKKRN